MNLAERCDRLDTFIREGKLVRNEWGDGYERACLLAALVPEVIDNVYRAGSPSAALCPASVLPGWFAMVTPAIDDETSSVAWADIVSLYSTTVRRTFVLDKLDWKQIECVVLAGALRLGAEIADNDLESVVEKAAVMLDAAAASIGPTDQDLVQLRVLANGFDRHTTTAALRSGESDVAPDVSLASQRKVAQAIAIAVAWRQPRVGAAETYTTTVRDTCLAIASAHAEFGLSLLDSVALTGVIDRAAAVAAAATAAQDMPPPVYGVGEEQQLILLAAARRDRREAAWDKLARMILSTINQRVDEKMLIEGTRK